MNSHRHVEYTIDRGNGTTVDVLALARRCIGGWEKIFTKPGLRLDVCQFVEAVRYGMDVEPYAARAMWTLGVTKNSGGFIRVAMVIVGALLSGAVAAEQPFPPLAVPDTANPAVAAFVAWHAALVKGDFGAYRKFTPAIPDMSDDMLRQVFDQLRSTAPKTVKIAPPETIAPGAVRIHSAGCKGNQPVINIVTAGKQNGVWIVAGSEWGPSWDPRISDHVKCP